MLDGLIERCWRTATCEMISSSQSPAPFLYPSCLPALRGEVWSLDVDPSETRLATGCSDNELRVFAINASDEDEEQQGAAHTAAAAAAGDEGEEGGKGTQQPGPAASRGADFLVPMGSVRRQATDRAETVRYTSVPGAHGGVLLTCQSAGKVTEVFRVRSAAEAARKMKRRRRRKREKAEKKARAGEGEEEAAAATPGGEVRPGAESPGC